MKFEISKRRIRITSKIGWIDFWWFPQEKWIDMDDSGYWQITGHLFCEEPFDNFWLETAWSFGSHCGYSFTNALICMEFMQKWKVWSPYLYFKKRIFWRKMKGVNCYSCRYRGDVVGSAHSSCNHPSIKEFKEDSPMLKLMAMFSSVGRLPPISLSSKELNIELDEYGVRNGWANFPWDFDVVWIKNCDGWTPKIPKEVKEELRRMKSEEKKLYGAKFVGKLSKI